MFCTGYREYAFDALQLHASGYLMKPVREDAVQREIDHIKGKSRAQNLQFDVLNGERLNAVNEKINAEFLLGLLDSELGKSLTGNYILIQTEVPEGHLRNPMMYTFNNTWNAADEKYHTYASVDLSGAMSDEQFAAFTEQLSANHEQLQTIFGNIAAGADQGLGIMREFMGGGDGYNSSVLTDSIVDQINALAAQIRERMAQPEEPAEDAIVEDAEEEVVAEDAEPVEPTDEQTVDAEDSIDEDVPEEGEGEAEEPAAPELTIDDLKAMLAELVNQLLNTYIPKASVVSYAANIVYNMTGDLFLDAEEAASILTKLAADPNLTFTGLNQKVEQLIGEGDFVVNGEVTKDWFFYNLSDDVFSNVSVMFHYVLSQLVPPELAAVIERALADDFARTDEMVQQIVDDITGQGGDEPDVPDVPDTPDTPDVPDTPDEPDDPPTPPAPSNPIADFISGIKSTFKAIDNFFERLF